LGKTIEAGIIMKELIQRGLVRTVLVLTPASLTEQWREELQNKFNETFTVMEQPAAWQAVQSAESGRWIASLDRAKLAHHREAILAACERGLHILTEKPIADTWEACLDIYHAVRSAGVKCQVVQNYRFAPHNLTLKQAIQEGRIGQLVYVVGRFAADYRTRGAWGMFRHEMPHGLLVEGAVHHLDQIRNLTGADCSMVAGWDWNPGHGSFDGECCALLTLRMETGVHAQYEGHCLAAGWRNAWYEEAYRAEGLEGSLVVDRDQTVRLLQHRPGRGLRTEELTTLQPEYASHQAIIRQFLDWLDGGPEPPTAIEDNIRSAALLFGAIRASETHAVVDVGQLVRQVQA